MRTTVYSYDRCLESAVAACAAPIVGLTAEHAFGFSGDLAEQARADDPSVLIRRRANGEALGNALLVCMVVPWSVCLLLYSGLHWTYKRDRDATREIGRTKRQLELSPQLSSASVEDTEERAFTLVLDSGREAVVEERRNGMHLGVQPLPSDRSRQ